MWSRLLVVAATLGGCDKVYDLQGRAPDGGFDVETCPESYSVVTSASRHSLYRYVVDFGKTWLFAHDACVGDSDGLTHLVVFDDLTELVALRDANPLMTNVQYWMNWTGFARSTDGDPNVFFSVTGDELPSSSPVWQVTEPNNGEGAFAETTTAIGANTKVFDVNYDADNLHGYICECDGRAENLRFRVP